jgi:flagellin-like protein
MILWLGWREVLRMAAWPILGLVVLVAMVVVWLW